LVTDWAARPPVPALAGALVLGAALVGVVVLELELELLLQPATASSAAATAAKPILLSLRTVVPPGVDRSCRVISLERRGCPGFAGRGPGSARRRSFSPIRPRDRIRIRLRPRFRGPDQASVRLGGDSLHGLLRWHRETWMNSPRKERLFSIRQLFWKRFKVTIASSVRRAHIRAWQVGADANGRTAGRGGSWCH
jgi:hypothetical protein